MTRTMPRIEPVGGGANCPAEDTARLLRVLAAENAELRDMVAELALQTAILRERLQQA